MSATQQSFLTTEYASPRVDRSPLASIDDALRNIFPTQAEETQLQKARRTLGNSAIALTDEELEVHLTEVQHLIDYWLDTFEQQLFDGMTLQQILREG
ncbi:MAG TPA: hypothetical protein VLF40_03900 [Candidatus Saccharimonadales bacterium]|nr:hypothetical protein [Candidatus Saccharimonadales bacterium]